MRYAYQTKGTCAMEIDFDLNGNVVRNSNGNLKAIAKLVDGMTVEQIESKLRGNTCGRRPTSCADQLAIAVRQAYNESK